MRTGRKVHQHLDWRSAEAWIGQTPFVLAVSGRHVVGCLACPPDPPNTSWVRLFATSDSISPEPVWEVVWPLALQTLQSQRVSIIAALELDPWLGWVLQASGFTRANSVVVLSRPRGALPSVPNAPARIRPMTEDDVEAVTRVDASAFRPPWQQSGESLRAALRQAEIATLAELGGEVVAYQISTPTRVGGHLARLATRPAVQGRGIGRALTLSALAHFEVRRASAVTVNTQSDNAASLALYRSLGFHLTGEEYPAYQRQP